MGMDETNGSLAGTTGRCSWHDLEAQIAAFNDNGSPPMTAASSTETVSTNDQDVHEYEEDWDLSGRRAGTFDAEREDSDSDAAEDYDAPALRSASSPMSKEQDNSDQTNSDLVPTVDSTWIDVPEQQVDQHTDTESEEEQDELSKADALALSVKLPFVGIEPSGLDETLLSSRIGSPISSLKSQRSNAEDLASARISTSSEAAAAPVVSRKIQVLVRVRPLAKIEEGTTVVTLASSSPNVLRVQSGLAHSSGSLVTECAFDHIFMETATQEDVFNAVQPSIQAALSGYNATVFAYGQTGTGKTHTIFGSDDTDPSTLDVDQGPSAKSAWGIIPRALAYLLDHAKLSEPVVDFQLSFMQIYNDRLFDLLTDRRKQKPLLIREQPSLEVLGTTNVVLQGLSSERFTSLSEALQVLRRGRANRCVRETEANASSSRSHAIVQINIAIEMAASPGQEFKRVRRSRLNLVDLAGSEKWNTELEMEDCHSLELKNINTSLSALGNCIAALAEPGRKHIPYRDSTLTRVLQDSFGGNTQASLIATISSHQRASEETIRTLQFADRARSVMQVVRVNESLHGNSELLVAKAQIVKLRERLEYEQKRRQETRRREFDAMQREFLETIQVKDKEIQKLSRGNSDLMKSRDEDSKKIRALMTRLQEMEALLQSSSQSSNNSADRPESPVATDVVERKSSLTMLSPAPKLAPLTPMGKPLSKPILGVKEPARNGGAKSYKYLLERYALGSKQSQRRSTEQTTSQRLPPTSTECAQILAQAPIARSIPRQPQPLQLQPSRVQSQNQSQQSILELTTSWKSAFHASCSSENAGSSTEEPRLYAFGDQFPPNVSAVTEFATVKDHLQSSLRSAPQTRWLEAMAAASNDAAHKNQSDTTPTLSWMSSSFQTEIPTWLSDSNQESVSSSTAPTSKPTAGAPASQPSTAACEKHRLKGCVLCANDRSAAPSVASMLSTSGFQSLAKRDADPVALCSSVVEEDTVPCTRHQLTHCFICSKTTTMAQPRTMAALSAEMKEQPQVNQPISFTANESVKCASHALTNCVLCAGGKSMSNVLSSCASMSSSLISSSAAAALSGPPRRFSLDDRSLTWTQSQETDKTKIGSFSSLRSSVWNASPPTSGAASSTADIVR